MIDMIDPRDLSPNSLAERLVADLERDDYPAKDTGIDTSGTRQAVARLLELVGIRACGVTV
jgi:predicted glycosyltransferase